MINLIPPSARKKVLTEYWVRVLSVWLLVFSISGLIVSIFLLPVYVLINSQIDTYVTSADEVSSKIVEFDSLASTINSINDKAQKLFSLKQTDQFSELIAIIDGMHEEEILIEGLKFKRQGMNVNQLIIDGYATDRKSLASFRDKLTSLPNTKDVNLPITNLAKDKDINFSVTITFNEMKN